MNNRKAKRTILKMAEKNYRRIAKNARNYCKKVSIQRIPIVVLNKIVDLSFITPEDGSPDFVFEFAAKYNTTLTTLKQCCETQSRVIGDKAVSLYEIDLFINELITSMHAGAEEKPETEMP